MAQSQIPLLAESWLGLKTQSQPPLAECHAIWDKDLARFTPCFIPYLATFPAIVGALILLSLFSRHLRIYLPSWAKPFIVESKEALDDLSTQSRSSTFSPTWGLLCVSLIGLALQIASVFFPARQDAHIFMSVAWGTALATLIIARPRTAPIGILFLFVVLLFTQLAALASNGGATLRKGILAALAPVASLLSIFIILNMPLRDPRLPQEDISMIYTAPSVKVRSPEDNLTPWQYMTVTWMTPLIQKGSTRNVDDEDVWDLPYEFKHGRLHNKFRMLAGSVTGRLLEANGLDLVRTTTLALIQLVATLSTPVLLQRLLASMKNDSQPTSTRNATVTYGVISLAVRLISAQCAVFTLWYSRRAYERSRGEMITMLYEKTLNRKILGAKKEEESEQGSHESNGNGAHDSANGESNEHVNGVSNRAKAENETFPRKIWDIVRSFFSRKPASTPSQKEPASMGKILNLMRNDVYEVAQRFWDFPDFIIKPLGAVFATLLIWQMLGWSALLGALSLVVTQVLNVLIARFQVYFEKKRRAATDEKLKRTTQFIESIRHLRWYGWQEAWLSGVIEARLKELHLRVVIIFISTSLSFVMRFGSGLFPVIAFYAFTKLAGRPLSIDLIFPAIDLFNLLEGYLRALPQLITVMLNAYVAMGRIEDFMQEPDKEKEDVVPEGIAELSLENASFAWPGVGNNVLQNLTLSFPVGLTVVYGEVAAGKTALLQALLGELDKTEGTFIRPDEVVGYCAQTPWLQSMNIRDNILFSYPYEEARYKQVLDACALLPDMAEFKHGDLSNIGENGIGLSGGQKARVALARAVYSRAKIVFLDDPLSALDHQTAEYIVKKLISGPLLRDRTTVLVTHRTELCHGIAKQWIELTGGRATIHEPTAEEDNALKHVDTHESVDEEEKKKREEEQAAAVPDKFIEDEHRATGSVKLQVYWRYIKSGTLFWWSMSIFVMAGWRFFDVALTWYIKAWGEAYSDDHPKGIYSWLPPPQENVVPWLKYLFLFEVATSVSLWMTYLIMFGTGYKAAKTIFQEAITKVAHATFRYYDVTPVGRLLNRITSDMNTIDGDLSVQFTIVVWTLIGFLTSVIVILGAAPAFLAFGVLLCCGFAYYFYRFLPTSQALRRLEMVSLSPLMSNFGALVEGLTTVRAFNAESRFQERVIEVVDNFQKNDHFYWSLQAWLSLRFSTMSASSTLVMTLIAVYTGITPGLTAFVLINASRFVMYTDTMCRMYGSLEMDFTSVERVVELLDLETEPAGVVDPPAYWPTFSGDIVFSDVTVRYAPNLDPALSNVTLRIPAGSSTAVIGRTGSGKSTLALTLLATIVAESGSITIDGIDIATVNRQALRSRITFLAQDPVLFQGSMRKNLDPLSEYSDAACENVLSKIAGSHKWTLSTPIEGGGKGLSQGQRQLVGLARAMLRRSAVLIMDEATASIDFETAQRIQSILREEMRESTVITIAHRLEAVKNADYCIVLGKGKLVRAGKAEEMLREGGELRAMLA